MTNNGLIGPAHQPGVYNIDCAVAGGRWTCVGKSSDERDALSMAGQQAALTGGRFRVCAPDETVVFDSAPFSVASAQGSAYETTAAAKALKLTYTLAVDECYRVQFDHVHQLAVIGDMANASYEWVIEAHEKIVAHSNEGHGDASCALRDGLIAYHGLGDVTEAVESNVPCVLSSRPFVLRDRLLLDE